MKRLRRLLELFVLAGALATCASAGTIPKVLFRADRSSEFPLFIAASEAFNANGEPSSKLFAPEQIWSLRNLLAGPRQGSCVPLDEIYESIVNPPDQSTIDEALQNSPLIVLGDVVEREAGFHGAFPGQLLAIRPSETIGERGLRRPVYYVFYAAATFSAGPYQFCKTDRRLPPLPAVGDEVLIFSSARAVSGEPFIHISPDSGIIVIRKSGEVLLPSRLRKTAVEALDREELQSKVRSAARREAEDVKD